MTYLTRLAAQTGLIGPQITAPAPSPELEVIEEDLIITTPAPPDAPPMPRIPDVSTAVSSPQQIVIDRLASEVSTSDLPDPITAPQVEEITFTPASIPPTTPEAPPVPEAPGDDASPEVIRNWQLRQVMAWVAKNEPQAPPVPSAESATMPDAKPVRPAAAPPTTPDIPSLEIGETREADDPAPMAAPTQQAPAPRPPPVAAPPSPPFEPKAAQPDAPQTQVVEETVQISIGTIRLNVSPPPRAATAPTFARTQAQSPPPAPPPPATTASRLARRYIRI